MADASWINVYKDLRYPEYTHFLGCQWWHIEDAREASADANEAGVKTLYRIKVTPKGPA